MAQQDKKALSAMKHTKWSMTVWFTENSGYTKESLENLIKTQMPSDWALEGQIEQGNKSDTRLHAQVFLRTPQIRGTAVAKVFPRCHIEEARNQFALENYVHKKDTRVDELKTVENRSPQWREVRSRFYEWYVKTKHDGLRQDDEVKLKFWDEFIGISLEEGMEIDLIGVNPQYRSCILKYWNNCIRIAERQLVADPPVDKLDRQTKDEVSILADPPESIFAPRNITCPPLGNPIVSVLPVNPARRIVRALVSREA